MPSENTSMMSQFCSDEVSSPFEHIFGIAVHLSENSLGGHVFNNHMLFLFVYSKYTLLTRIIKFL